MKNPIALLLSTAAVSLLSACLFQNPDSQPNATAKFEFQATASTTGLAKSAASGGLIITDASGIQFTLTEALVYVKRIQLESESDLPITGCDSLGNKVLPKHGDDSAEVETETEECDEGLELSIKGPFIVDLINGTSTPELAPMMVPAGTYNHIKLRLDHGNVGDTAMLNGSTLVAKGTFTRPDGTVQPVSLNLRFNEDLKIKSKAGIVLDASSIHTILVAVNAGDWLSKLDVAGCLASDSTPAGHEITVSEDSDLGKCLDAGRILKDNFRKSCEADEKDEHVGGDDKDSTDNSGKGK